MGARLSAPVQTGPGAHPASCTMGTGSFPGVKSGRGVTLTPHPLLVPQPRKRRAIPLLPLWAVRPVQNLEPQCLYKGALYLFFSSPPRTGSLTLLPSSDVPSNTHVQDQISSVVKLDGGEAHTVISPISGAGVCRRIITVKRNSSNQNHSPPDLGPMAQSQELK